VPAVICYQYVPNQCLGTLCFHLAFSEMRTHDKPIRATIPQSCLAAWVIEPALHSDRRQIRVHCTQASCSLLAIEVIHLFTLIERYWAVRWERGEEGGVKNQGEGRKVRGRTVGRMLPHARAGRIQGLIINPK